MRNLQLFKFPSWLAASARVDLRQLYFGIRPAARFQFRDNDQAKQWAARSGLFLATDADGYAVASRSAYLAKMILAIDRRPQPHTYELGLKLGYPACCCKKAAQVGECNIDEWERQYTPDHFLGLFRAISPKGYRDGHSFISHVPCSSKCRPSLDMAMKVAKHLGWGHQVLTSTWRF